MSKFKDIMEGHIKEILKIHTELSDYRLAICKQCPLFKITMIGPMCNNKWIDVNTGEIFDNYIEGREVFKGCMCRLDAKTKAVNAKCPAKFW